MLDVAVIGRPHASWGETVTAVVMPREGATPGLEGVREWLASRIARYEIPRELILRADLPRTASGKITRHVLRAELGVNPSRSAEGPRLRALGVLITSVVNAGWVLIMAKTSGVVEVSRLHRTRRSSCPTVMPV